MKWLTYLRIGRAVYQAMKPSIPQVGKVPVEDLIAVVEEVLTSPETLDTAPTTAKVRSDQRQAREQQQRKRAPPGA